MKYCTKLTSNYLESLDLDTIRTNKGVEYLNIEAGLDIETSSTTSR